MKWGMRRTPRNTSLMYTGIPMAALNQSASAYTTLFNPNGPT